MSYIDTRELDKELDELEARDDGGDCETCQGTREVGESGPARMACPDCDPLDDEEQDRLAALRELRDEIPEWSDGNTLIPEYDFEEYAQQLAEDIGAIPEGAGWPLYCIDWEHAARELAMDYGSVEWEGTTYLYHY